MILSPVIRQKFFSTAGVPLVGGKLYSYIANTTTPQATYTDQGGGTPNANPVVLDSNGEANVWMDPSLAYKFILQDVNSVVQWTVDNVSNAGLAGLPQWNTNSSYSQGNIVADSSGSGLLYVSLTNSNLGNVLTSVANWRMFGGSIRTVTGNTTLAVTDELVRSDSTSGALTHTLPACATTPIGKRITVKDVGTGGFTTSVKGAGSDNVDGANTYVTPLILNQSATFENNGSSWDASGIAPIGSVTQNLLAPRASGTTVVAGGVIKTSSSGSFTASSSSFVNVTNLSGTITTTGRPVMLIVQSDGSGSAPFITPGSGLLDLQFFNNTSSGEVGRFEFNGADSGEYPVSFSLLDFPPAGTYNYLVRAKATGTSGVVAFVRLVAFEI